MSWREHDDAASHFIASSDEQGLRLHLRAHGEGAARPPVLFVHGATFASRLYDIPHPGASWLKATAKAGFAAYALDIRGYGRSRSAQMAEASAPYAHGAEAVRDIADAVAWVRARHGGRRIALIGGSWGSITTAMYAAGEGGAALDALVLYAPIFAERNTGWLAEIADPDDPSRPSPGLGASRLVNEARTRARWDAETPPGETWRDEAVFQALMRSSLADDPDAAARPEPAFAAPNGTLLDLWEAFNGRPLYDPARIATPALLLRGGADPTSTRSDALALLDRLGAATRRYVEIANGAHFVSAERRAPEVFGAVVEFLRTTLRRS